MTSVHQSGGLHVTRRQGQNVTLGNGSNMSHPNHCSRCSIEASGYSSVHGHYRVSLGQRRHRLHRTSCLCRTRHAHAICSEVAHLQRTATAATELVIITPVTSAPLEAGACRQEPQYGTRPMLRVFLRRVGRPHLGACRCSTSRIRNTTYAFADVGSKTGREPVK